MEFDFDRMRAVNPATLELLEWVAALHSELADTGAWQALSTQTHNELVCLARTHEAVVAALMGEPQ